MCGKCKQNSCENNYIAFRSRIINADKSDGGWRVNQFEERNVVNSIRKENVFLRKYYTGFPRVKKRASQFSLIVKNSMSHITCLLR